jgi:hypothetical protein
LPVAGRVKKHAGNEAGASMLARTMRCADFFPLLRFLPDTGRRADC